MGLEPRHADQRLRRMRRRRAQLVVCTALLVVVIATAGVTGNWAPFWTGVGLAVAIVVGWVLGEFTVKRLRK